jgi:tRNA(Ile2) C34 agmatinyltransferase TiaS
MTNDPTERWGKALAIDARRRSREMAKATSPRCPDCGGALVDEGARCLICGWTRPAPKKTRRRAVTNN